MERNLSVKVIKVRISGEWVENRDSIVSKKQLYGGERVKECGAEKPALWFFEICGRIDQTSGKGA